MLEEEASDSDDSMQWDDDDDDDVNDNSNEQSLLQYSAGEGLNSAATGLQDPIGVLQGTSNLNSNLAVRTSAQAQSVKTKKLQTGSKRKIQSLDEGEVCTLVEAHKRCVSSMLHYAVGVSALLGTHRRGGSSTSGGNGGCTGAEDLHQLCTSMTPANAVAAPVSSAGRGGSSGSADRAKRLAAWFHSTFKCTKHTYEQAAHGSSSTSSSSFTVGAVTLQRLMEAARRRRGDANTLSLLFVAFLRCAGHRARYVVAVNPVPVKSRRMVTKVSAAGADSAANDDEWVAGGKCSMRRQGGDDDFMSWAEVLLMPDGAESGPGSAPRWVHFDVVNLLLDAPKAVEGRRRRGPLGYVLGVDGAGGVVDVTARYCSSYAATRKVRLPPDRGGGGGGGDDWLRELLRAHNARCSEHSGSDLQLYRNELATEQAELNRSIRMQERLPTTVHGFKGHPLYVLEGSLRPYEALDEAAKELPVAVFEGQRVYLRDHVRSLLSKWQWKARCNRLVDEGAQPVRYVLVKRKGVGRGRGPGGRGGSLVTVVSAEEVRAAERAASAGTTTVDGGTYYALFDVTQTASIEDIVRAASSGNGTQSSSCSSSDGLQVARGSSSSAASTSAAVDLTCLSDDEGVGDEFEHQLALLSSLEDQSGGAVGAGAGAGAGAECDIPVNEHGNVEIFDVSKPHVSIPPYCTYVSIGGRAAGPSAGSSSSSSTSSSSSATSVAADPKILSSVTRQLTALGLLFAPAVVGFSAAATEASYTAFSAAGGGGQAAKRAYKAVVGGLVVLSADAEMVQELVLGVRAEAEEEAKRAWEVVIVRRWRELVRAAVMRAALRVQYGH